MTFSFTRYSSSHNSGLPIAVCISFLFVLLGLTLGWGCVKLHQHFMHEQILDEVQQKLKSSRSSLPLLSQEMKTAAQSINDRKSWSQRMFSFKAAHGILMFVSWINMTGRIFGSNQSGDFTCHTYPVYKQLDSPKFQGFNHSLMFLPTHDPNYAEMPWSSSLVAWALGLSLLPLLGAAFIGTLFARAGACKEEPPHHWKNHCTPAIIHIPAYNNNYYYYYDPALQSWVQNPDTYSDNWQKLLSVIINIFIKWTPQFLCCHWCVLQWYTLVAFSRILVSTGQRLGLNTCHEVLSAYLARIYTFLK